MHIHTYNTTYITNPHKNTLLQNRNTYNQIHSHSPARTHTQSHAGAHFRKLKYISKHNLMQLSP